MELDGNRGKDLFLPHLLGHEGTGVVQKIGESVSKVKPGDKVILSWIKSSGLDAGPTFYDKKIDGVQIQSGPISTLSDLTVVSENRITKISRDVPLDLAALIGCAIPTGAGMVRNYVTNPSESNLAVVGLGGVGTQALIEALDYNFKKIVVVDQSHNKLEWASKYNVECLQTKDLREFENLIVMNDYFEKFDYVLEATGISKMTSLALGLVKPKTGLLLFASHPKAGDKLELDPFELIKGKRIEGTWGGNSNLDADADYYISKLKEKESIYRELIPYSFNIGEINIAINKMRGGKILRPIIDFSIG